MPFVWNAVWSWLWKTTVCLIFAVGKTDNGKAAICNVMGTNGTFVKYNLEQSTDNDEKNNQIENSNKGITFKE